MQLRTPCNFPSESCHTAPYYVKAGWELADDGILALPLVLGDILLAPTEAPQNRDKIGSECSKTTQMNKPAIGRSEGPLSDVFCPWARWEGGLVGD